MSWIETLQGVGIGIGICYTALRIMKEAGVPRAKFNTRIATVQDEYRKSQEEHGTSVTPEQHQMNAVMAMLAHVHMENEGAIEMQRQRSDMMSMQIQEQGKQIEALIKQKPKN